MGDHSMECQNPSALQKKTVQIYPPPSDLIPDFWRDKYEKDAKKYWDLFYKRNTDKFFKDRHYLHKEWGDYFERLAKSSCEDESENIGGQILEVGCGVGNTVYPLRETYPNLFVYACDFSQRAINIVKAHKDYNEKHVHAFVSDVTCDDLTSVIPEGTVDIATLVFCLSAISPEKMPFVLQNIRKVLKPNGLVLVRDYAVGDLAQERFSAKIQKISQNFYVRGDGTRAFYFTEAGMCELFRDQGFHCEMIKIFEKQVENRARELIMDRRWIQGTFRCKDGTAVPTSNDSEEIDLSEGVGAELFGLPKSPELE